MVAIAQLVEPRVVISVVVGSSPISHPIYPSLSILNTYNYTTNKVSITIYLKLIYFKARLFIAHLIPFNYHCYPCITNMVFYEKKALT